LEYDNGATQIRRGGTRSCATTIQGTCDVLRIRAANAGGFAVFPDENVGMDALHALLASDSYQRLSIDKAIARYAPEFENNTAAYRASITRGLGVPGTTQLNQLSDVQLRDLTNIIHRVETWQPGRVIGP
jgi:hypothetical protein